MKAFRFTVWRDGRRLGDWELVGTLGIAETYIELLGYFKDWLRVMHSIELRPGDIVVVKEEGIGATYRYTGDGWEILDVKSVFDLDA